MTTEEFIAKQRRVFSQIIEKDDPLRIAAQDTLAKQATRIFVEGKNSYGALIGHGAYNDNKPLYANPKITPGKKFKPEGKPFEFGKTRGGKTKTVRATTRFVNGESKPHQTRWFPSYKELRRTIGRGTDKVDLFMSGDLKSDFCNSTPTKTSPATPIKNNVHEYATGFKRDINVKKVEGLESKVGYGPIFHHSKSEKDNFFNIAGKEFTRIIVNA